MKGSLYCVIESKTQTTLFQEVITSEVLYIQINLPFNINFHKLKSGSDL